jgi:CRISPR-associated protein Csm1
MNRDLLLAAASLDLGRLLALRAPGADPSPFGVDFLRTELGAEAAAALIEAVRAGQSADRAPAILARAEAIGGGWGGRIDGFLRSPFAGLDLGLKRAPEEPRQPLLPMNFALDGVPLTDRTGPLEHYIPALYSPSAVFPLPLDTPAADPSALAVKFIEEARAALKDPSIPDRVLLNRLLALLLRYAWFVPVDAERIVSVYDKARIAVAAAAALDAADAGGLLLVGGDISGIQSYLFDISDPGNREVARRLRARSFFLSRITDVFLHRLLERLDLPDACTLFNSGGRFLLLLPANDVARDHLRDAEAEINLYLLHHMLGDLSFQVGRIEVADDDLKTGRYRATLERLSIAIEERKSRRFAAVLESGDHWNPENFVLTEELFKKYANGVCVLCHKLPSVTETGECENCAQDALAGRKLTETTGYRILSGDGDIRYLTGDARLAIELHRERSAAIRILNPSEDELVGASDGFLFMNNHVPSVRAAEAAAWRCPVHGESLACSTRAFILANPGLGEWPVALECLAGNGARRVDAPPEAHPPGVDRIGVLKADVDRLGMLFSLGLRDRLNLPNYALLSRLVDLYFSGYTRTLQRRSTIDYGPYRFDPRAMYTVFAGGDDLLFIGPWDVTVLFANLIYRRFRRFTGNHPEIALSAGVAFGKPGEPLAVLVEEAEASLERSKDEGRDRITVFDTSFRWRDFDDLFAYAQLFDLELMKNRADVEGACLNPQALRRIEAFGDLCDDALSGRDPGGVIWIPRFLRYIEKRLTVKDRYKNVVNQPTLDWLKLLFQRRDLMSKIRVATQWAAYRNRKSWE